MEENPEGQTEGNFGQFLLSKLRDDPDWFLYDALNKALPLGYQLKPWSELDEQQRATIVLHVSDMYLWRSESKVDPGDAEILLEQYPKIREMCV
jgi:hypothetical protein